MNENLLQFIWQYSLYQPANLQTKLGEKVIVVHPGKLNRNAGPDFLEAKIKIGETLLVGNVELHIKTSDWFRHGHQHDDAYRNLVLHIVYEDDIEVDPNTPLLNIGGHIPAYIINQYSELVSQPRQVPCSVRLATVRSITKESMLSRLLAERWEQKLGDWQELLNQSAGDWRNLLYWRTAANFGFKVNAAPFLMLAQSIPLNILARHNDNPMQVEALLFGQAGMLSATFEDYYPNALQKEYAYLKQKYKLLPVPAHLWKFLRMRPANFPTIRIAQFAALVQRSAHLFSQIIETNNIKEIRNLLEVKAGDYWDNHFTFDAEQKKQGVKKLGEDSIDNIIINTIAPIKFLYAHHHGLPGMKEDAIQLIESVPAEQNNIITLWKTNNWAAGNAAQSQALIQLYNNYCTHKRCLECTIGLNIIRRAPEEG